MESMGSQSQIYAIKLDTSLTKDAISGNNTVIAKQLENAELY